MPWSESAGVFFEKYVSFPHGCSWLFLTSKIFSLQKREESWKESYGQHGSARWPTPWEDARREKEREGKGGGGWDGYGTRKKGDIWRRTPFLWSKIHFPQNQDWALNKISSGEFSEDGGNYTLIRTSTWTWKRWDGHLHGCACVSLPFICAHVVGTLCQLWDAQPSSSSWEDFIQLRGSLDHSAHKEMKLVAKSSSPKQALNFSVSFLL